MPNLDFSVRTVDDLGYERDYRGVLETRGFTEISARLEAVNREFRGLIKDMIKNAQEEGKRVAIREAPRGPILRRNEHSRISDAIVSEPIVYRPGGAGGGGDYEGSIRAEARIAPHLGFVYEGTGNKTGHGLEIRGNLGSIMVLQKGGEEVKFRRAVSGQRPQQRWWLDAEDAMYASLQEQTLRAEIIHGRQDV